jgi:hypothetical protein
MTTEYYEELWVGSGHPDRPRKGGQTCGRDGVWIKLGGVWYNSPYRSKHDLLRKLEQDTARCHAYVIGWSKLAGMEEGPELGKRAEELSELFF